MSRNPNARLFAGITGIMLAAASSGAAPVKADGGGVIKIAIDLPFSGTAAATNLSIARAVELEIKEANSKGLPGGFTIETVRYDHGIPGKNFDVGLAAENARANVADPEVVAVFGTYNSAAAKAEIPILNAAGLAMISSTNTSPGLTKGAAGASLRTTEFGTPAYWRVCGTDDLQGPAGAQLASQMGLKKIYIVDDADTYGKGLADLFTVAFQASGGVIVGHEQSGLNQRSFADLIAHVKAARPDGIYFGGEGAELGEFRREMAVAGIDGIPLIGGDAMNNEAFARIAGPAAKNSFFTVMTPNGLHLNSPLAQHFARSFKIQYGADPLPYDAGSYAAAQVIVAAIKRAIRIDGGTPSRREVNGAIAATHLETAIGLVSFTPEGDISSPYVSYYSFDDKGNRVFVKQFPLHGAASR